LTGFTITLSIFWFDGGLDKKFQNLKSEIGYLTILELVRLIPSRSGLAWIVIQSMPQSMSKNKMMKFWYLIQLRLGDHHGFTQSMWRLKP
jgi:hypothetical protein